MDMFIAILIGLGFYQLAYYGAADKVREALEREGITPTMVEAHFWKGSRYHKHVDFAGFSRATNEPVAGYAHVRAYTRQVELVFTRDYDRTLQLRERLAGAAAASVGPDLSGLDFEQRVAFETNERLERLMADRAAFMANDTDGDGVVDSEEWAAVRARISAEVRAELEGGLPQDAADGPRAEDLSVKEVDSPPEVVGEQPAATGDGHW